MGGGSCYDPAPDPTPGARCQLEQLLRTSHFVRVGASVQWNPGPDADTDTPAPLLGSVDPVSNGDTNATSLTLSGWVADPTSTGSSGIDGLSVYLGTDPSFVLASATLGIPRSMDNPDWSDAGFSVNLPLQQLPTGATSLTLAAHSADRGTWLSRLQIVVPALGSVPVRAPVVQAAPAPTPSPVALHAEIQTPQPNSLVGRSFVMQVFAPGADRVDVFMEPDRDAGGRLLGSSTDGVANVFSIPLSVSPNGHTLYIHAISSGSRQDQVLTLPIIARS
jgi:hypothetical protein